MSAEEVVAMDARSKRFAVARHVLALLLCLPAVASAVNSTTIVDVVTDPPTLLTLGVQVVISGDDDGDAKIAVRYRRVGTSDWLLAQDLVRVDTNAPSWVVGQPRQLAGSIFNLQPATAYEVELTATDLDGIGGLFPIQNQLMTTRAVPPTRPTCLGESTVVNATELREAFSQAGTKNCINVRPGLYEDNFTLSASGTPTNPIIIRRAPSHTGAVILDGGCPPTASPTAGPDTGDHCRSNDLDDAPCAALTITGSNVIVEHLEIRNAERGILFTNPAPPTSPASGNVVRRVKMTDVCVGITNKGQGQTGFYVCDNELTGRVPWPVMYVDANSGTTDPVLPPSMLKYVRNDFANASGVQLAGSGHVVCHNTIAGFGDGIRLLAESPAVADFRGYDIYGNDILSGYDNAIELDYALRNVRAFRNRMLNSWAPLSFQPIFGGPVYALRNVMHNVVHEPLKFHDHGTYGPTNGVRVFHNTVVTAPLITDGGTVSALALHLTDDEKSFNFRIENNIFFGRPVSPPPPTQQPRTVKWDSPWESPWDTPAIGGLFDFNGYAPDGRFQYVDGSMQHNSLAQLRASANPDFEEGGKILVGDADDHFVDTDLVPPSDHDTIQTGQDFTLQPTSIAVNAARPIANINDGHVGAAPDMGAIEESCPKRGPIYGPRPLDMDDTTEPIGCESLPPDGPMLCSAEPVTDCQKPVLSGRTSFRVAKRPSDPTKTRLIWYWKEADIDVGDFGDPSTDATYYVCAYETLPNNGGRRLALEARIPAGGQNCGTNFASKPCWRFRPNGWNYTSRTMAPDGVRRLNLRGDDRHGSFQLNANGSRVKLPSSLQFQFPVTVQLRNTDTEHCWDVDYSSGRSTPLRFDGRDD
jgi:hypothetical protein